MRDAVDAIAVKKKWYTASELAELMGVSRHHVSERWCNQGRIASDKAPESGQWRIPGHEYERLKRGGKPLRPYPDRNRG
jgi:predicted site-specific integrase-resolvase